MKREVMTPREWRKHHAGSEFPPLLGIIVGTCLAFLTGAGLLMLMALVW